ncbi:MAG: type II toxin-antitoxin system VapC family toxin [Chloroflexi bacterium]|nr:type II toxin-antitoxin system VapC family toxin [Chloroflexota bacterium]
MPSKRLVLDSSVLVALISGRDSLHAQAVSLISACVSAQIELVYFDCVVSETLSVLGRRMEEQKKAGEFQTLFDSVLLLIPESAIVWLTESSRQYYGEVIKLMRESKGKLNFNDCLIAIGCRELGLDNIVSFDPDFDTVTWLRRVSDYANPVFIQRF